METDLYRVHEDTRVELRVGHALIERFFAAGLAAPADAGDRLALEHLVSIHAAHHVRRSQKKAKRRSQEVKKL